MCRYLIPLIICIASTTMLIINPYHVLHYYPSLFIFIIATVTCSSIICVYVVLEWVMIRQQIHRLVNQSVDDVPPPLPPAPPPPYVPPSQAQSQLGPPSLCNTSVYRAMEVCVIIDELDIPSYKIDQTCFICLDEMNGPIAVLPCLHQYHEHCIREWFQVRPICPLCQEVVPSNSNTTRVNSEP